MNSFIARANRSQFNKKKDLSKCDDSFQALSADPKSDLQMANTLLNSTVKTMRNVRQNISQSFDVLDSEIENAPKRRF